uniref:Biogenic amine-like GPCR n=1 Tax=Tripedalia cystophora TaxID=6141 RepID=A0A481ZMR2_TRICY|nr:biogenic amine-like GPCR [Tripedalia cystophora]
MNSTAITPNTLRPEEVVELVFLACLVVVIIFGNVMVCLAFATVGDRLKTITNYFVINLATSDILVGVFSVPFWIWVRAGDLQLNSKAYYVFIAFDILSGTMSILNLTVISLERMYAVRFPAKHRNIQRQKWPIHTALGLTWCISLIMAGTYYIKVFYRWHYYTVMVVSLAFGFPTTVIIGSYIVIFSTARKHVMKRKRLQKEIKLAVMIGIVIILFLLCWSPFFLMNVLLEYCPCKKMISTKFIPLVKFLHYSNSMMNPCVYAYRNSDFRSAFKKLLCRWFPCDYKGRRDRTSSFRSIGSQNSELAEDDSEGKYTYETKLKTRLNSLEPNQNRILFQELNGVHENGSATPVQQDNGLLLHQDSNGDAVGILRQINPPKPGKKKQLSFVFVSTV